MLYLFIKYIDVSCGTSQDLVTSHTCSSHLSHAVHNRKLSQFCLYYVVVLLIVVC